MAGRPPKSELKDDAIMLRRDRVQELIAQGNSQRQVAIILNVSRGTVNFDMIYLRQKAKENIKNYIDEKLPEEFENCLVGINSINREAWSIAQNAEKNTEKIQALSLSKECYSMKLDLLTNAEVIKRSVDFVDKHRLNKSESEEQAEQQGKQSQEQEQKQEEQEAEESTTNEVF